jgi:hypothetical protein
MGQSCLFSAATVVNQIMKPFVPNEHDVSERKTER